MAAPVFEEFEPASDCACGGCVRQRRARTHTLPLKNGGHPAAHGARRALVLATAAGVVLGGGGGVAAAVTAPGHAAVRADDLVRADDPDPDAGQGSPQGGKGPLHGPAGKPPVGKPGAPAMKPIDRTTIINRAKRWVREQVPYSMSMYWRDGYRQDCSGYVSMAWNLGTNEWTGSLDTFATRITKEQLRPGDMLLFHNPDNPTNGSHVTIFGGWADYSHTYYTAYEQARPYTRRQITPYAYWNNADHYVPYRYKALAPDTPPTPTTPPATPTAPATPSEPVGPAGGPSSSAGYPGAGSFGPGANNAHVTRLGEMLAGRGAARFYGRGPGPRWGEADRLATKAFQEAQGWKGADADGLPGVGTWRLLVQKKGKDIPRSGQGGGIGTSAVPAYPGKGVFRPGQSGPEIERLGRQLVKKGFGKYYASGPGPRWDEADRRNVEAFQRAQGWRGAAADGYPGPETWRRLFA
ncbi:peptidoglycan-binding protein [Streptomyces sp. A3M-1-3]|uniref:peptidoglycan-binding protein n=1 Tax=Streptomyces sp. A3M-1-3 TaxID=2962044 RepID=UPI0020B7DA5B|nr:peptidoglycan-binding protein [Streptomyces sp. A3M-1-3]MCP3819520.1 peptidoglycan-binding protein [Streptomyces sp. A3M-1-3]